MASSLDRVDKEIVCILQEDGRTPISEMARTIGVSEPTIRRKLGRLLSEEIVSIRAISDPFKLGFGASAYIGLDVELGRIEEVAALLGGYPMIESVAVTTGPHDITIKATFDSIAELTAFVVGELASIEGIKDSQ